MKRREFLLSSAALAAGAMTAPVARAAGKPTLRIGHLPLTDHLTIIAHGQTAFQQFNLEPVKFGSWAELSEALKVGAVQGAFALTPIGLTLRQKGVPIKAVLAGHRNGSALTVRNTPQFNRVEDLKGKTVAIPSRFSTHNLLIRKLLAERGLKAEQDVRLIEMAPPEMVNALATGRIDAFIVAEPFGAQAEIQKVGKVLVYSKDVWKDHICCALNLQEDVVNRHPEAVDELVTALVRAGRFIEANPAEAARLSVKYLGQKQEVIEHVLTKPRDRVTFDDLRLGAQELSATQDYMVSFGVAREKVDLGRYLDDRFVKRAYA